MPHAAPSRQNPSNRTENEASSVLKLGEFQDVDCLNYSEVHILLEMRHKRDLEGNKDGQEKEVLRKTREHLEIFAAFKNIADAKTLEGMIKMFADDLTQFEMKALGSLVPENAEEAKALIPSLQDKLTDGDLEELCKQLHTLRFQAQQRV